MLDLKEIFKRNKAINKSNVSFMSVIFETRKTESSEKIHNYYRNTGVKHSSFDAWRHRLHGTKFWKFHSYCIKFAENLECFKNVIKCQNASLCSFGVCLK